MYFCWMTGVRDGFSSFKSILYFCNKEKLYWWVYQIFCVLIPCLVMQHLMSGDLTPLVTGNLPVRTSCAIFGQFYYKIFLIRS